MPVQRPINRASFPMKRVITLNRPPDVYETLIKEKKPQFLYPSRGREDEYCSLYDIRIFLKRDFL